MIPFAATDAAKIANAFELSEQLPKLSLPFGELHPHLIQGSLGPP